MRGVFVCLVIGYLLVEFKTVRECYREKNENRERFAERRRRVVVRVQNGSDSEVHGRFLRRTAHSGLSILQSRGESQHKRSRKHLRELP